jgi:hypothetical protein
MVRRSRTIHPLSFLSGEHHTASSAYNQAEHARMYVPTHSGGVYICFGYAETNIHPTP